MFTSSTKLFQGITPATSAAAYQISRSLRFNSADSAYLNRTPASAGNRKTWTWSCWFKFGLIANANYRSFIEAFTGSADVYNTIAYENAVIKVNQDNGAGGVMLVSTPAVFRDPGAWYHLVVAVDTTQATGTNRVKLWINGVQQTLTFSVTPAQNLDTWINSANAHRIGARWSGPSSASNYDGYMTEINFIDGQALTPSSFGQTDSATGVWSPIAYTGTYGTNGFYLNFSDNSGTTSTTLGKDSSGNSNNWTPNNFSVTAGVGNDSLVDSPTNYGTDTGVGGEVRGNYATWNPLERSTDGSITNGNLDAATGTTEKRGNFWVSTGKWYFEITPTVNGGNSFLGVVKNNSSVYVAYDRLGRKWVNGTQSSYGATYTTNDVIGFALDADAQTITFYKNGASQGAISITESGPYTFFGNNETSGSGSVTYALNAGQRPFAYTAPSGFKALCTQNLPTPTIGTSSTNLADDYFNAVLYTGTGANLSVTGIGFQPDFVWVKSRSATADHALYDAVRGVQKQIESNTTAAETTESTGLTAFGSDGFTVGSLAQLNTNTATYVAWNWKAGGTASTNTSGSITSNVSVSTTAGFSIVTYTGTGANATVGHSLSVAPKMLLVKSRNNAYEWKVWQISFPTGNHMILNNTAGLNTSNAEFTNTIPTNTVFSIGTNVATNGNGATFVAYCFAEIAGFSRFGSYTGNGSTDGPFIYCGFRPRYVMVKRTDTTGDWVVVDTARDTYNVVNAALYVNIDYSEATVGAGPYIDILSNGFKNRTTFTNWNASNGNYIFMAFAESPFNYSRAR